MPKNLELHVFDEFSPLKKVAVCFGTEIPYDHDYKPTDPEEIRWGWHKWDRDLMLRQQDNFFSLLQKYGVELLHLKTKPKLIWQMYTRDIAFVIGDQLFYGDKRTLVSRRGESDLLLEAVGVNQSKIIKIPEKIEGGDVLVTEGGAFVGISNRTSEAAVTYLQNLVDIKPLALGDTVMHLDTVLTLLPRNHALIYPDCFSSSDLEFLKKRFKLIPVLKEEQKLLGTNVFIVNPETIIVEESSSRIKTELVKVGFKIESIAYTEPIILGGSFRCTTLPLVRE